MARFTDPDKYLKHLQKQLADQPKRMDAHLLAKLKAALNGFLCPAACGSPLTVSVHVLANGDRCPKLDGCCDAGLEEAKRLLRADHGRN